MGIKKVVETIYKNKSFLISSHINLETDALGSELGLYKLLRLKNKKVQIVNQDKHPKIYNFLPGIKTIKIRKVNFDFDAAFILDCSDLNRIGNIERFIPEGKIIVNIDHHISNCKFGDVNWVDSGFSSASEMIYHLYKRMKVKIDKDVALQLYAGIVNDTGSFRFSNTTWRIHCIASELIKKTNIKVDKVYQNIYESNSFTEAKFLSSVFDSLKRDKTGKIVYLEAPHNLLNRKGISLVQTENALTFARTIRGAEIIIFFREILPEKVIKVNIRSRGKADVNKLAKVFGGGGHKTASGCTVRASLERAKAKVLAAAAKLI